MREGPEVRSEEREYERRPYCCRLGVGDQHRVGDRSGRSAGDASGGAASRGGAGASDGARQKLGRRGWDDLAVLRGLEHRRRAHRRGQAGAGRPSEASNDGAKLFWDQGAGRKAKDVECQIQEATKITGSAFPPSNWTAAEFDDGQWVRTATPMGCSYRSLSLVCLRGKFTVNDPAQVEGLSLDAKFQGGAVFHLNGQEIGRASMPQGKIDQETLADDYPKEAFVTAEGGLLPGSDGKDADIADRAKKRYRQASLQVPAAALRKGINVLAIEVHRAPAAEAMYTRVSPARMGYGLSDHYGWFWNRASLEDLKLTAKAGKGVVEANFSRPAAVQVWNQSIWERVDPRCYGDPVRFPRRGSGCPIPRCTRCGADSFLNRSKMRCRRIRHPSSRSG